MSQSTRYAGTVSATAKGLVSVLGFLAKSAAAFAVASTRAAEEAGRRFAPWAEQYTSELNQLAESGDHTAAILARQPAAFAVLCKELGMREFASPTHVMDMLASYDNNEQKNLLDGSMSAASQASVGFLRLACEEALGECGYELRKANETTQVFTASDSTTARIDIRPNQSDCSIALDLRGFIGMNCRNVRHSIEDSLRRRGVELRTVSQHANGSSLPEAIKKPLGSLIRNST